MSSQPPNKKKAPEKKQIPEPEKQEQQKEGGKTSGLDPLPLLEKYARCGIYLKWLWPVAEVSFVVAAIFIFSTIPGNYKALQPGQHVVAESLAMDPQDSSSLRLGFTEGIYFTMLESKDGGKHYLFSSVDTWNAAKGIIDPSMKPQGYNSAAK